MKRFKAYEPGFVHVDIKYLPQMPDADQRTYLFAAIDRATRWVYVEILRDCLGTLFRNSLTVGSLKKINNLFIKDIFHGYCLKRQSLNLFAGCGDYRGKRSV